VNPHRADCPSRFKELAGVGVAFKLICALEDADGLELLEYYADLVTLGTIADIVPLVDENRVIARHGLRSIPETENAGIRALLEVSGMAGKIITGESAAFGIIPRINASGRVGLADDVIELLLTDDAQTAEETATKINAQNETRKEIEEGILREIETQLSAAPELLNGRLLLLSGKGWHHGVVGIAASKLMEKYGKPVILFSREKGIARGSGRSLPGFSLIGAVTASSGKLTRYGGHMLAAGMTLAEEDLPGFFAEMETYAATHYPVMPVPELRVDWVLSPEELTIENLQELSCLEPFGAGNEQPLFLLPGLRVEGIYPTADGKHLRLRLQFGNHLFYAVFFRMTEPEFPFSPGDMVDVVAAVTVGEWNGSPQLSVRVRDIRPQGLDQEKAILSAARYQSHHRREYGELCPKEEIAPSREDVAIVYRYLRKAGSCFYSPEALYYRLHGEGIDLCRLRIALDVLTELRLTEKNGLALRVKPDAPKVELASSQLLSALTGETVGV
jgi:single-stranded-DNA-specific exonuclease